MATMVEGVTMVVVVVVVVVAVDVYEDGYDNVDGVIVAEDINNSLLTTLSSFLHFVC